jgi:hypothetical protein
MSTRPKYIFCWWCSRQLWGKRTHVTMRSTNIVKISEVIEVIVHRACADDMEREGGWEEFIGTAASQPQSSGPDSLSIR